MVENSITWDESSEYMISVLEIAGDVEQTEKYNL